MIEIEFIIDEIKFYKAVKMPSVPRKGEQIFSDVFATEKDEIKLLEKNYRLKESYIVDHVTWIRDEKTDDIYVMIFVE